MGTQAGVGDQAIGSTSRRFELNVLRVIVLVELARMAREQFILVFLRQFSEQLHGRDATYATLLEEPALT
jgi:hypothetical protein